MWGVFCDASRLCVSVLQQHDIGTQTRVDPLSWYSIACEVYAGAVRSGGQW